MRAPPTQPLRMILGSTTLDGDLTPPARGFGLVVFAHGSGSSRQSPRNRYVAYRLAQEGFGTLLFDLLTEDEDRNPRKRFDIPLLAERLITAVKWLQQEGRTHDRVGLFGASTGSAAALIAAAALPNEVAAVVSRGGRPDLAEERLPLVRAATLFIVGGEDHSVIELNEQAYGMLSCEKDLRIVPGATHLFEEPGALEQVATIAVNWFGRFLVSSHEAAAAAG